ncbi:ROK family protein [Caballeronia calidae]|uniref:ROK family protein n=1 Tax=Caballeronia calidae TaxID=1777139 RepID=A0A158E7N8_9BURK|nr:ROK family transcriptional regulator [Caballeronia calidae]SAL02911.1 ROK family protein [Caballeronia calidae]
MDNSVGSTQDIRRDNRRRVLELLREHEPVARNEIARIAGLTEPAISRITRELVDTRLIEEIASNGGGLRPGRPVVALRLCGDGAYVIGINISADNKWVCIADMRGDIRAKHQIALPDSDDPASVVASAAQEARRLIESTGIDRSRLLGIGVTVAGTVDPDNGELTESPNLGWSRVPLARMVEAELDLPVTIDGRSMALLRVEKRIGAARNMSNAALVLPALGIGGAVMIDGRMARGRANRAGQIGHLRMSGSTLRCVCGRVGCLDTLASGHAILQQLNLVPGDERTPKHEIAHARLLENMVAQAASHDAKASEVLRAAGRHLGLALRAVAAVADPEAVFLAGEVGHSEGYLQGVREAFTEDTGIPVVPSTVTNDMAAIWLALEAFVYSRELDMSRLRDLVE